MLNSIIFYLLFSFVGFLSSCLFVDRYNYKTCVKNDSLIFEIRRLGFFLFISFCVPYLLYLYQAVKFVVENGYLAVYLNESSTTVDNPILRISDDLCVAGIYLYLSTFPIGKKYILVSCFYIFTLLILLGTGGRSATFTQVLAFLVYLGIRGIRVNWRWMFSIPCSWTIISLAVCLRLSVSISKEIPLRARLIYKNSLLQTIKRTFANMPLALIRQGLSMYLIGLRLSLPEKTRNSRFPRWPPNITQISDTVSSCQKTILDMRTKYIPSHTFALSCSKDLCPVSMQRKKRNNKVRWGI